MKKNIFLRCGAALLVAAMLCGMLTVFAGEMSYSAVIPTIYDDARDFSNGLAPCKKNGKWGYINEKGNVAVPFIYDEAYTFAEGKAVVGKALTENAIYYMCYGFVDTKGNFTKFIDGKDTWFRLEADSTKTVKTDDNLHFYNNYVMFPGEKHIVFDGSGSRALAGKYTPRFVPTEGIMAACIQGTDFAGYTDTSGNLLFPGASFGAVRPFNQGLAPAAVLGKDGKTAGWSFINASGRMVIPGPFSNFYVMGTTSTYTIFNDSGLASVCNMQGKWGAIDKQGKTRIPFKYQSLKGFKEGLAAFCTNGKYGYMDKDGNVIIEPKFDDASTFNGGFAVVRMGNSAYCINREGDKIIGADQLPVDTYFVDVGVDNVGTAQYIVYAPGEFVITQKDGKYGFGRISYAPTLPQKHEMSPWAYDGITAAITAGLVPTGLQNMYFENATRADFAALTVQLIERVKNESIDAVLQKKTGKGIYELVASYPFSDTNNDKIVAAYALGIVNGVGGGKFEPYGTILRQDAAAMLKRTAEYLGLIVTAEGKSFADTASIEQYAKDAIAYVSAAELMNGKGSNSFSPTDRYTREEAYLTILRLHSALQPKTLTE